jgi:hypothetical protein
VQMSDLMRYVLWGAVAATAHANRREYHMLTTWFPHLVTNTVSLLLPDVYRLLLPKSREAILKDLPSPLPELAQTLTEMIRDNPSYGVYVAPLAAGYILSHPKFNIYKGKMGDMRLAGFGLDSLPHSSTALGLTALVCDTIDVAADKLPKSNPVGSIVKKSENNLAAASAFILALLTFIWEFGEYLMYRHEMAMRGDITKINMQWSVEDTTHDALSNFAGWALALVLRGTKPKM